MIAAYPSIRVYTLKKHWNLLRDEPSEESDPLRLHYHLKTGDYFASLATILGFIEETLKVCKESGPLAKSQEALVRNARTDLIHLQKHHRITEKTKEKSERID